MKQKEFINKEKIKKDMMEADIFFAQLKSNCLTKLISATPEAEWVEYHAKSNTKTEWGNIKTPIEGNTFLIRFSEMTPDVIECLSSFFATLAMIDDIRIFNTSMNTCFIATQIEANIVSDVWDWVSNVCGYTTDSN
jgi:hypothetical protein